MKVLSIFFVIYIAISNVACFANSNESVIKVGSKTIVLPTKDWKEMRFVANYSLNFERTETFSNEKFGLVVTIFKIPMSIDDKKGRKIGKDEWVEMFSVHRNCVTVQIAVDKGSYWVMGRQTYKSSLTQNMVIPGQYTVPSAERALTSFDWSIIHAVENEVKKTRYILHNVF